MTQSTTRGDRSTPTERRAIDERMYWEGSLHVVEDSSASIIAGLEFPIVGGLVEMALDHAIATAVAMLRHPDPDLRWTADVAILNRAKLRAIVRRTPAGPEVLRFDSVPPPQAERVSPGWRASRDSCLVFLDGSIDSTCYGLGTPMDGRDLTETLEQEIRSYCEATRRQDAAAPVFDNAAISFRGRFVAIIRLTPEGPVVTRFDLPASSTEEPAEPPAGTGSQTSPLVAGGRNRKRRSSSGSTVTLSS